MNLPNSRMNRRTFGGIGLGLTALGSTAILATAQDATPEVVEEEVTEQATLAKLETAAHMWVTANKYSYSVLQAGDNMPGWYVFEVENASEADASMNLAQLPEGVEPGDFTSALFQVISGNTAELPEWWGDVTYAGGTYVPVGGSNSALVHLTAGEWVIFSNLKASQQSVTKITISEEEVGEVEVEATPEVTGDVEVPAGVTPPADFGSTFTVSVVGDAISADANPSVGYNVIGVRNDADVSANFIILRAADAVESDAAADLASAWLVGEAVDAELVVGMGALSPDAFGYIELTAEAGTYIGFSSGINAEGGSQIEDGAVMVFTVA